MIFVWLIMCWLSGYGTVVLTIQIVRFLHYRTYNQRMLRIMRLELANGYGIDYSREWFDKQKMRGKNLEYDRIADLQCYGCGKRFNRSGVNGQATKLCSTCRRKAESTYRLDHGYETSLQYELNQLRLG